MLQIRTKFINKSLVLVYTIYARTDGTNRPPPPFLCVNIMFTFSTFCKQNITSLRVYVEYEETPSLNKQPPLQTF